MILDRPAALNDIPTEQNETVPETCDYCGGRLKPVPCVFWSIPRYHLFFHSDCASKLGAHLSLDAAEARIMAGLRRRLGEDPIR